MKVRKKVAPTERQAFFVPSTYDPETHTVEVVWTQGSRGLRYDWWSGEKWYEELEVSDKAIRMERLNLGAPLCDTHHANRVKDVIGVVERAWVEGGEGRALVRFSQRAEVNDIEKDVADGILRNLSCRYETHRFERVSDAEDGTPVFRAVDWEPSEISLVPIGFDMTAQVRSDQPPPLREVEVIDTRADFTRESQSAAPSAPSSEGASSLGATQQEDTRTMGDEIQNPQGGTEQATAATATTPDTSEVRAQATRAEQHRAKEIRTLVRMANLDEKMADDLIDGGVPLDQARSQITQKWADQASARTVSVHGGVTRDERDKVRTAMQDAIALRANPRARLAENETEHRQAIESAREFRGMRLLDLARESIEAAGGRARGLSSREIAQAALNINDTARRSAGMHATSDFPEILANTVNRTLRQAYQLSPKTFTPFCRQTTAPDFREVARVQMSELSRLHKVNEGGEYKIMTFGDGAEKYALVKYGGIIPITWEALVNDNMDAFDRIPLMIAEEASANESDIVYGILTGNPLMADEENLFDSVHGNIVTGPGTVINDTNLGIARAMMRKQTGPQGRVLNLAPEFLIVGPDNEMLANKYTSASFVAAKASDINPNFNTSLEVIVEGRIQGRNWYMSALPSRIDTIEYAYLEGEEGLFTEQKTGFEVDGLLIKARHVFAAKAIDHRGLFYNSGAAS
ncbi:hypothetical protein D3C87_655830 [compost metagenome]